MLNRLEKEALRAFYGCVIIFSVIAIIMLSIDLVKHNYKAVVHPKRATYEQVPDSIKP